LLLKGSPNDIILLWWWHAIIVVIAKIHLKTCSITAMIIVIDSSSSKIIIGCQIRDVVCTFFSKETSTWLLRIVHDDIVGRRSEHGRARHEKHSIISDIALSSNKT
jgi:hypothetical protein